MLYIVPTPLGNLGDITERALQTLRQVKTIYCEDTRRTRILLTHFGISAPTLRYNEHHPREVERILERLHAGEDLALVSDSGTPVISDPGLRLVREARASGIPVQSLPGPNAITTALAGSGLPGDSFVFLGFLPRSDSKRRRILESAAEIGATIVIYESPMRVMNLLRLCRDVFGATSQTAAARELTKIYEEWTTGTLEAVESQLASKGNPRGEFVILIHPGKDAPILNGDRAQRAGKGHNKYG